MSTLPRPFVYLLRLCITTGAMALTFSQVPLATVIPLLASIPWPYLLVALVLTHAGQVLSALRTRYYLHCQQIDLSTGSALKLHYAGGLFNAFLPGGAGGDAYKAWWLKRHRQGRLLNMVKLMVAGRLNGLWALCILLCAMAYGSEALRSPMPHAELLLVAIAVSGTLSYSLFARWILHEPVRQQAHAALYSLSLQLMLVGVAYVLCHGFGLKAQALDYTILFLLSCILAMLPISIGGIGVRELALLHGSKALGLSEHSGVALAFAFTILSLTIPLAGAIVYHFYPPERNP